MRDDMKTEEHMKTEKTFFLGLGGQKCGSSWYRAYLARQPGSDFGRLGEYQVWEADLGGVFARYRVPPPKTGERMRARLKRRLGAPIPAQYLRWRLQLDRTAYFDYFERLLDQKGVVRTGDVTPSYAALPAETLAEIRERFAARGITVKVIFAMRDPVARLASHLGMEIAKGRIPPGDFSDRLLAFHDSPEARARSRYDQTLAAIEAVFPEHHRHICLFEEMVTPSGVVALSHFAGVAPNPDAGAVPVNSRSGDQELPERVVRRVAEAYAPVYRAVAARLPNITQAWPSMKWIKETV